MKRFSMNRIYWLRTRLIALGLVGLTFVSCTTQRSEHPVRPSDRLHLSLPGSSTDRIKSIPKEGANFFIKLRATADWKLEVDPKEATSWISLERSRGEGNSNTSISILVSENLGIARSAQLIASSAGVRDTLVISQQGTRESSPTPQPQPSPQPTPTPTGEYILGDATMLEVPELYGGKQNYFVTHRAGGIVNYSLEYDTEKRHPRFVCFTFDKVNSAQAVKRSEAWAWDPQLPNSFSTEHMFRGSGYDRGHMVASSDRLFSLEANRQTFYYTNMSPQLGDLNQKFWANLERQVQAWGRNSQLRDVLYVAKGGTLRDGQVESKKVKGSIVIPKYYWMALVLKKGSSYHGIGFWVEHRAYSPKTTIRSVALSIDELEEKLGMNLFHNFPDDIETQFEAESPAAPATLSYWPGL
ncbi:DNA/RNA non-specific endonuclease [Porphyromonas sp.]